MPKGREEEYFDFPVTDSRSRSTNSPIKYEEGGQVKSIYEKNQAKRDELKKKSAEAEKKRQERKAARKAKRAARRANRKARRADKKSDKNKKKIQNLKDDGVEVTTTAKKLEDVEKLNYKGKLKDKKNIKKVEVTEGGAYPTYKKDTKQAKSFNEAFAAARKAQGPGGTFEWNGRSYSTNRADDKPKDKPKVKKGVKGDDVINDPTGTSEMPKKDVDKLPKKNTVVYDKENQESYEYKKGGKVKKMKPDVPKGSY